VPERKRHFSKKPSQNQKIFFENFLEAEKSAHILVNPPLSGIIITNHTL